MTIDCRPLNHGEVLCCGIADMKKYFENEDIKICFGTYRKTRAEQKKSLVVCSMHTGFIWEQMQYLIKLYPVRQTEYSDELRKKFVDEVLPFLKEKYLYLNQNRGHFGLRSYFECTCVLKEGRFLNRVESGQV